MGIYDLVLRYLLCEVLLWKEGIVNFFWFDNIL